jgi:hypothetical protein
MGASTGVQSRVINNIYVSYSDKDSNAIFLHEELILRNMKNVFGPIEYIVKEYGLSSEQLSTTVKNIMSNSFYIIIYISRETVGSYYRAIEINHARDCNTNVIYIMTDVTYTPNNTSFLKRFVEKKQWFPAYDEETTEKTLEELVVLLQI